MRNHPVPIQYAHLIVDQLKLYGLWLNNNGFESPENWTKSQESINALETRCPPYGVSMFGRIHCIFTYYLCMFNYVMRIATPVDTLVKQMYKAMNKFIFFPSKANVVKRSILTLGQTDGGINFPDLEIRKQVNRLILYIRVLSFKEALSWRKN